MTPPPLNEIAPGSLGTLLTRLLAIAEDAVIVVDELQRIAFFSAGAERIFGYFAGEVLDQPLALLLPEAVRDAHVRHMREFARERIPARSMAERAEVKGRRADGTVFDVEASILKLELDGRTFFAAIMRDVSASRQSRRALARSEERFRQLAATAPVGIFQTDAVGHYLYVNQRWTEMAGLSATEAAGTGWSQAVHPQDRGRVQTAWREAVDAGVPFDLRYRFLRADGAEIWVVGRAVASLAGDGEVTGFLGTVTDVTENQHQTLALAQAKAEAEAAARAKSLFLANMSHEIRTPLNAVIGMTTLLLDTPMSADQLEFARTIRAGGEALLEIVNDILDFSRADAGKMEIDQHVFDLRRCVEEALDMVAPRAHEKGLNLACMFDEGMPAALLGDSTRIRQILVNLLVNAVKFTQEGEVLVTVSAERLEGDLHRVDFSVSDTGIGIAPDQLPRLFESFTQADASTTRKFGGTGLGLAICKRLAELMGGTASAQSEPGRGSVFRVTIQANAALLGEPPEYLRDATPDLQGKRLLIVGDNQTNRRILTRLAQQWGMVTSTLPSAVETLDRLDQGARYDLAVIDMAQPERDGLDLAMEMRRRYSAAELPIVLLSSLSQRQPLLRDPRAPGVVLLTKPIKAVPLYETLTSVAKGRPEDVAVPTPAPAEDLQASTLRVLVAEDNAINQRVASQLLRRLGYRADVVANGLEVIDAVERHRYDVVLMDIQMPEMDGLQAAQWIVQRRAEGGLPRIIAMTANVMPGDAELYAAAGMDGHVAKPIALADLAQALTRAVGLVGADGAAGEGIEVVLDRVRLEHLRAMQDDAAPTLVRDLIDLFVADMPGHLASLTEALDASDAPRLARLAHRLLSVTENLGLPRLSALCIDIERLARQNHLARAAHLVALLAPAHETAQAALLAVRDDY